MGNTLWDCNSNPAGGGCVALERDERRIGAVTVHRAPLWRGGDCRRAVPKVRDQLQDRLQDYRSVRVLRGRRSARREQGCSSPPQCHTTEVAERIIEEKRARPTWGPSNGGTGAGQPHLALHLHRMSRRSCVASGVADDRQTSEIGTPTPGNSSSSTGLTES